MDVKLKPFDFAQAAARAGMPQVAEHTDLVPEPRPQAKPEEKEKDKAKQRLKP